MKKIIQHSHYVYITEQKAKPSHAKSIKSRSNNKVNTTQNFQHAIKIEAFTKKILEKISRRRI